MSNQNTPNDPVSKKMAKEMIEYHMKLSENTEHIIKKQDENVPDGDLDSFIEKKHNAYVFTKEEIMKLFDLPSQEGNTKGFEKLAIVLGAHEQKHLKPNHGTHQPGEQTAIVFGVNEHDDYYETINSSNPAFEFPWLRFVQPGELTDGKMILKKVSKV